LKPERWGSPLVQEKYEEEKACDKRNDDDDDDDDDNNNNNINNNNLILQKRILSYGLDSSCQNSNTRPALINTVRKLQGNPLSSARLLR
jgi:hypothetical protein